MKIGVHTLDKNFESEYKEMTVEVSDYNPKEQEIYYTFKVPDHIYNALLDTAPEYTVEKGFKKTIRSISIKAILITFDGYCNEITSRASLKEQVKVKKIFVRFNHNDTHDRCEWTGGYMGKIISSSFQFFVGYEIMEQKRMHLSVDGDTPPMVANYYTLIRHKDRSPHTTTKQGDTNFQEGTDMQPLYMPQDRSKFLNRYAILDWSQEAEDFLRSVQDKFVDLNKQLSSFLSNLDNDKLKKLMEGNGLKMLNK